VTTINLTAPFLDEDLSLHRDLILHNMLPALQEPNDPGLNTALVQMANAVANQAAEAHTARLAREIEKEQPTMPTTKFNALYNNLKAYLNVTEDDSLPDLWFTLAASSKRQEFSVVREAPDAFSRTDLAFINIAPVPTPKLVSDLTTITFVSDHSDNLKTGIQPFVVMEGSEDYRLAVQDLAREYILLSEREFGLSYADLSHFKVPKELRGHPITFYELEKSLGMFGNLLQVVLGAAHPITVQYRLFWSAFSRQYRNQMHFEIDIQCAMKPVHILRNIQLICLHWFQAQRSQIPPAQPQFLDILQRISLSLYHNPNLPPSLYQFVATRPGPTQKSVILDTGKSLGYDATTATGLSTLTGSLVSGSQQGSQQGTGSSRAGTFVKNPAVDPTLQSLLPTGIKITELVSSDAIPTGDDNTPFCLSYHIRGGCFSNFHRCNNHNKQLSTADKQTLSNWLVDQTAKLRKHISGN